MKKVDEEVVVLYRCTRNASVRSCPCCEAENETDERFCFFCGASLTELAYATQANGTGKRRKNGWIWAIGMVAAAGIAASIILAFLFM